MEFEFVSPLNRKQILLDWINTIDEPKCLLAGSLGELKDGEVFLEIILHYLKINNKDKYFLEEFKEIEKFDTSEKFEFIVKILKIISDDDEFYDYFSYENIIKSEEYLLEFIYRIKKIYTNSNNDNNENKYEENKNYFHEEEGKSNNLEFSERGNLRNNQNKANKKEELIKLENNFNSNNHKNNYNFNMNMLNNEIKNIVNKNENTNENSYISNKPQNNNKTNNIINEREFLNLNKFETFDEEKFVNKNKFSHYNSKSNNINEKIFREDYSTSDNNLENYVISETYKTTNNMNLNNDLREISNDYIQSTSNNNLLNLSNINNTYYSNNNNNLNNTNSFIKKNNENLNKDNFIYSKQQQLEFKNTGRSDKLYKEENRDNKKFNDNFQNKNFTIDRNIDYTLEPKNNNNKIMEITQATNINIITAGKLEKKDNNTNNNTENNLNYNTNKQIRVNKKLSRESNLIEDLNPKINNFNNSNYNFNTNNNYNNNNYNNKSPNKSTREDPQRKTRNSSLNSASKINEEKTNFTGRAFKTEKQKHSNMRSPSNISKENLNYNNYNPNNNNKNQNEKNPQYIKNNIKNTKENSSSASDNNSSLFHESSKNNLFNTIKENKNNDFSKYNNLDKSKSPNKSQNANEIKIKKIKQIKIERNELYTDDEISQLNVLMGNPIKNKFEINSQKLDYFFFHKITQPIINIDYDNFKKFKLIHSLNINNEKFVNISYEDQIKSHHENKKSINTNNYSRLDEDFNQLKKISSVSNRNSKSPSKRIISRNPSMTNNDCLNLVINTTTNNNNTYLTNSKNNNNYNNNKKHDNIIIEEYDSSVNQNLQIKIINWLISINMIKEGAIKPIDIPRMCANGVFLSDLINRLEGKLETIKGIIRKTVNKSHIQVNINKLLDYLRSLEKFNSRNLWSNNEICAGEAKTIFELLDDIWNFYSNKSFDNRIKNKSKNKENSFCSSHLKKNLNLENNLNLIRKNEQNSKSFYSNNVFGNESNKNKDNSSSISLVNSNRKNASELNKIREMNAFSPINKIEENKYNYQNTNSDIFNAWIGESEKLGDKSANINKGLPPKNSNNNTKILKPNNNSNSINKSSITHRNRDVIANCLGIEQTRIFRNEKRDYSRSISNIIKNQENEISLSSKISPNKNNNKEYQIPNLNNNNTRNSSSRIKNENSSNIGNKTTRNHSKPPENINSCFIIFNKSNIKNLKNEIQRYDSKNVTIDNDHTLNVSGYDENRRRNLQRKSNFNTYNNNSHYDENKNLTMGNLKSHRNMISNDNLNNTNINNNKGNDNTFIDGNSKCRYLLSSPESKDCLSDFSGKGNKKSLAKCIINLAESKTKIEKDDILIREWLDGLGCKNTFLIDLTKEELTEFRDGLILADLISILENKKIHGINPNPRCINACTLNISKVLEILRARKNMPYDYLWSEEEIYKGNPNVIIEFLKQIKKAYNKESEYLIKNKNMI